MPFIQIKIFKNELNQEQCQNLISKVTDAVTSVTSEKLRDLTWINIEEVNDGHWGVGGKAIKLDDVKKIIQET